MSAGMNRELDAAEGYPLTIGRGTGLTIKEFNRQLKALMKRKKMQPLTLGGGPARAKAAISDTTFTHKIRTRFRPVEDAWAQL